MAINQVHVSTVDKSNESEVIYRNLCEIGMTCTNCVDRIRMFVVAGMDSARNGIPVRVRTSKRI